ncbi:uncharacterized protein LOC131328662 [Rhododendron vialii]|uniref:uncharacterized protein LOC131328662 n=1 Tax=Rhododendron vialii TaxID=182163 RepID=UPI00265E8B18|nr:uncharacterized protein LOC131328662 [Rhododendron vialii]
MGRRRLVRNDHVFNNSTKQPWEVGDLVKTRVAMWMKAKFDIKVYTVEDFKVFLDGIRKVRFGSTSNYTIGTSYEFLKANSKVHHSPSRIAGNGILALQRSEGDAVKINVDAAISRGESNLEISLQLSKVSIESDAEAISPVQAFPTQLSPQNLPFLQSRVPSSKVIRFLKSHARSQIFSSTPNYIIKDDIRHITISSWISLLSPGTPLVTINSGEGHALSFPSSLLLKLTVVVSFHEEIKEMKSKASVFLGLLFAVLLLVTSAVAEETTSKEVKKEDETKESNQWGGPGRRCPFGCCGYGLYGRCSWCCRNANEASQFTQAKANDQTENEEESEESNQFGGPGRRCRFGCCGGFLHGRCRRCCRIRNANEASQFTQAQAKGQTENADVADTNRGGWGGGRGGGSWGGGRGGGGRGGGRGGVHAGGGGGYGGGGHGGGHGGYGGGEWGNDGGNGGGEYGGVHYGGGGYGGGGHGGYGGGGYGGGGRGGYGGGGYGGGRGGYGGGGHGGGRGGYSGGGWGNDGGYGGGGYGGGRGGYGGGGWGTEGGYGGGGYGGGRGGYGGGGYGGGRGGYGGGGYGGGQGGYGGGGWGGGQGGYGGGGW